MYRDFFGLRCDPFNVAPDPRFLAMTRHDREALACLGYGIIHRKGFVLLTGEPGTGKTTLLNKVLDWARLHKLSTAFVFNPRLNVSEFFNFILADFGIPVPTRDKSEQLLRLNLWLLERVHVGEGALLVIDEAHELSFDLLEEIRLLTNLETSKEKLLQVVLCGQLGLEEKLRDPQLRQLWQRILLRCRTHPLTVDETRNYIRRRLHVAGANGTVIFEEEAMRAIAYFSCGIARMVNVLCEHALINAFVDRQLPVTASTVVRAAQECQLDRLEPIVQRQLSSEETVAVGEK